MMLKQNMGTIDRALRIGSGLAMVSMAMNRSNGIMSYLLPAVGGMLLLEGLTSYSVIYDRMCVSTRGQN